MLGVGCSLLSGWRGNGASEFHPLVTFDSNLSMFICPRGTICQMHPISIIPAIWWTFVSDRFVIGVADLHPFILVFVTLVFLYIKAWHLYSSSLCRTQSPLTVCALHTCSKLCVCKYSHPAYLLGSLRTCITFVNHCFIHNQQVCGAQASGLC